MIRRRSLEGMLVLLAVAFGALVAGAATPTDRFESPPVHPLEISPDGRFLFAVHTDDHRVAIFDLTQGPAPVLVAEVPVGLEPVSVRYHAGRLWVVNHLSDSVSLVDLTTLQIVRTLLVGDEPTDVIMAGTPPRAFVVISQEDRVRVYDAGNPGPVLADIPLDGSDPRNIARSMDGSKLYVTILDSGNGTTVVPEPIVASTLGRPPSNPPKSASLPPAPDVAVMVKHDGTAWRDEIGRSWNFALPYTLLDHDVIEIDAASLSVSRAFQQVGTAVFNVAVNPATGTLYVTNQEALNHIRFEPALRARFVQSRMTAVNPVTGAVTVSHLNPHINLSNTSGTAAERALSLAMPLDVVVSSNGQTIYLAAMSSRKVGVLDASGNVLQRVTVGQGPAGLALDEARGRLYVLNGIDHTISVVSLATRTVLTTVSAGFDPVPDDVRIGQALFYDAANASAHGDLSCATCHLFMGMDNLAWDLGNPQGTMQARVPGQPGSGGFHPMKGPMTTQSMKGLTGTSPFHWRGDRGLLISFNPAFVNLLGRSAPLTYFEFPKFEAFVMSVRYPPNPFRNLDGSLPAPSQGPSPARGEQLFLSGGLVDTVECVTCHTLPRGQNGMIIPRGSLQIDQDMDVPHLRNLYEKTRFDAEAATSVRGFGFSNDGSKDDLFTFLHFSGFTFHNDNERHDVAAFLLAFDTGTPPGVGAQWTLDGTNESAGAGRLSVLASEAEVGRIGLIAKGRNSLGERRGWAYQGDGFWSSDRGTEGVIATAALYDIAGPGTEITVTGVLPGCETRLGIDRDEDGYRDRDELDGGSNPADPNSTPSLVGIPEGVEPVALLLSASPNPAGANGAVVSYELGRRGQASLVVLDVQGRLVRTLVARRDHPEGTFTARWNLEDDTDRRVAGGVYFLRLETAHGARGQRLAVIE